VSWCEDKTGDRPPSVGLIGATAVDDDLTCAYQARVNEGDDPCRKQVVPQNGNTIQLQFECPPLYTQKWLPGTALLNLGENDRKMFNCVIGNGPDWTQDEADDSGDNFPYCGKIFANVIHVTHCFSNSSVRDGVNAPLAYDGNGLKEFLDVDANGQYLAFEFEVGITNEWQEAAFWRGADKVSWMVDDGTARTVHCKQRSVIFPYDSLCFFYSCR